MLSKAPAGALVVLLLILLSLGSKGVSEEPGDEESGGGKIRGGIVAIDDPRYVSATEADIRDDAWVLGVIIGGKVRAYSLDLLNAHEVVNDSVGETNFAAVW